MIRIMERIASLDNPKLDGIIEHDQLYVKSGIKGRNYHDGIIKERMPRRRGLKPPPGRGTFESDQSMILCCHQRGGRTVFNVPVNFEPLLSHIYNTVSYGSTVYTDEYLAYRKLQEYGFEHDTVCHGIKEYARGYIHTNNCKCRANPFQYWLGKFRGVNKYDLYTKTFEFMRNNLIIRNS
jgi:transposase-like protein